MFENVGMWEVLILIVAALFILGPERLPDAMAWVGRSIRKVREFATGARNQLRDEIGPEFEQFREPIEELRNLRKFDPKRAVTEHIFDGDEDPLGLNGDSTKRNGHAPDDRNGTDSPGTRSKPLEPGEKAPIDPDAT